MISWGCSGAVPSCGHLSDTLASVTRRKQHRPGIAPNANTTHVPTAGSSAALTKPATLASVAICRIIVSFARMYRVGVWLGFLKSALLLADLSADKDL